MTTPAETQQPSGRVGRRSGRVEMFRLAMAMYSGERCRCGALLETLVQLCGVVWDPHDTGRISHHDCYRAIHGPYPALCGPTNTDANGAPCE